MLRKSQDEKIAGWQECCRFTYTDLRNRGVEGLRVHG
jgi:hypothetical protein